ncbi:BZ3500_MvSof-1268-A1-R1_Chr1-1g01257 [Microbotryum saponariae]|uniref:BZ3500_MvSof-1268-A1-R1_Chr1-1g01257 protein n=1 Tax=Microbotryum saponariae TaxID=289078 RepID=A0A2X0KQK4_9BASI|nr:BZ3500_MvSof-1268-A1-R1_Chr1-1g01257 [Microbotryum saponariae]SCZ93806.1 BZ3501_MvSof-1269-A2-R1_Chr1-1g00853 [Microbotryum saponariae]
MPPIKLSQSLKTLIGSSAARGAPLPAPSTASLDRLFAELRSSAKGKGVGSNTWLTLSVSRTVLASIWRTWGYSSIPGMSFRCIQSATLTTLNSPDSLKHLYTFATKDATEVDQVRTAALMREVGLKCISFNGIPRSINNLAALRSAVPASIQERLGTTPTREPKDPSTVSSRAKALWNSIYDPQSTKLLSILSASHPDLPVHILNSHYGALLADPPVQSSSPGESTSTVGRILTSLIAISCLRAQGGVEPQVISHVFGLRKASFEEEAKKELGEGGEWLTSEDGAQWCIDWVDRIVDEVARGEGPTFATRPQGGLKAKL